MTPLKPLDIDIATKIFEKLEDLERRLFKDNGGTCLQSKINRNTTYIMLISTGVGAIISWLAFTHFGG
jgi:hypothetical protein